MLKVTDAAAAAAKSAIAQENRAEAACLRVRVRGGGCSGLVYDLEFDDAPKDGDRVIEHEGVRFLLDARSEIHLAGTELDYSSGLKGQGFVFRNPDATGTCGCGKSFSA